MATKEEAKPLSGSAEPQGKHREPQNKVTDKKDFIEAQAASKLPEPDRIPSVKELEEMEVLSSRYIVGRYRGK